MRELVTLEEGMPFVEWGLAKSKLIMDGRPCSTFTNDEFMKLYDRVYVMCTQQPPHDYSPQLYERYKRTMEEAISEKVLPSLIGKENTPLLRQVLYTYSMYRAMAMCIHGFYSYADRHISNGLRGGYPSNMSLNDIAIQCFHDLVYKEYSQKIVDAAVFLIREDCAKSDMDLVKNVTYFLLELGRGRTHVYQPFEMAVVQDSSRYYSHLASEWLSRYSSADYALKVACYMKEEREKSKKYLLHDTVDQLLQVMHWQMVIQTESQLNEKQKAEKLREVSTFQGLIKQCANLSLEDANFIMQQDELRMLE